jgi:hypothetical protein
LTAAWDLSVKPTGRIFDNCVGSFYKADEELFNYVGSFYEADKELSFSFQD